MHNTVVIFSSNDNFTLKQVFVNAYMCFFSIKTCQSERAECSLAVEQTVARELFSWCHSLILR